MRDMVTDFDGLGKSMREAQVTMPATMGKLTAGMARFAVDAERANVAVRGWAEQRTAAARATPVVGAIPGGRAGAPVRTLNINLRVTGDAIAASDPEAMREMEKAVKQWIKELEYVPGF